MARASSTSRRIHQLLGALTGATPLRLDLRFDQLRRDMRMVEQRLIRGVGASPHIERRESARTETTAARALRPRQVRVTEVVRETPDAVSIYFEELDGQEMAFEAGQFMTVEVTVGGEKQRRAYSLAGASLPGARRHITVKRIADGRVSTHLNENAAAGQLLSVLGPSGAFTMARAATEVEHLVLLAGGSGITPIASLAETALRAHDTRPVTLVFGNRSERDVIFRERLAGLVGAHPAHFTVDHVLEQPEAPDTCTVGRLDQATTLARLDALGIIDQPGVVYFVCGPTPMMDSVRAALDARGVPPARIREESFGKPEARQEAELPTTPQAIRIRTPGRELAVIGRPGETVLEAGRRAGLEMPFSCAMGGCGACRVRLVEGTVAMDEPNCLSSAERAEGYVLACVAHATSPCSVEVES